MLVVAKPRGDVFGDAEVVEATAPITAAGVCEVVGPEVITKVEVNLVEGIKEFFVPAIDEMLGILDGDWEELMLGFLDSNTTNYAMIYCVT